MSIKIQLATYGVPGQLIDVTERVQLMVRGVSRSVVINNETMGADPAVGHVKQLSVLYVGSDGQRHAVEGREGSTISLADAPQGLSGAAQWPV